MNSVLFKRAIRICTIIISSIVIMGSVSSCGIMRTYAAYYSTCFCYKGQWSSWENHYFSSSGEISCALSSENDIIGLSLKDSGGNTYYSFKITNYSRGKGTYSGIVEYYVDDFLPTAEQLAQFNTFLRPDFRTARTPSVKRTAIATINIVNDERKPAVFNLWYDNIGVGISVRNVKWGN